MPRCAGEYAAPREAQCRRGNIDKPIAIRSLKRFVTDRHGPQSCKDRSSEAARNDLRELGKAGDCDALDDIRGLLEAIQGADIPQPHGERVAIIGSGPAGLACAHDLCLMGYRPVIFEMESCPTSLCLATLEDNTYCLKCTECVRSCPNDNVAINIRPFAEDLFNYTGPRLDEAILAVVLLSLTSFHGLTMTPFWENVTAPGGTIIGWITSVCGTGRLTSFTIGMTVVLAAPMLLYIGFCVLARGLGKWLGPKEQAGAENVSVRVDWPLSSRCRS